MAPTYLPYDFNFLRSMSQVRNLLVVVAMDSEERALIDGLSCKASQVGRYTQISFREIQLPKCNVLIARSGIGPVNAGVLLTLLREYREIDAVILLGVGGALDESLEVGDVVVSRQVIQHDSISSRDECDLLIAPGELTLSLDSKNQVDPVMYCDSVLVDWVTHAVKQSHKGKVLHGTIVSGSEFAANSDRKAELRKLVDDAYLIDMEASGLAQVARRMKLPFVAAKTVADKARAESSISSDYVQFLEAAAAHSGGVMKELLKTFRA